jgi:hypothetical protein
VRLFGPPLPIADGEPALRRQGLLRRPDPDTDAATGIANYPLISVRVRNILATSSTDDIGSLAASEKGRREEKQMAEIRKRSFPGQSGNGVGLAIGLAMGLALGVAIGLALGHAGSRRVHAAVQRHQSHAPTLSAPHEALARLAGRFDRVVKFVGQTGAAGKPSSGTSTFSAVLGGRFILEKSKDVVFGRPVEGLRIYGYNDATNQYEMARMYTMSTGITMMTGTSSDAGKTIEYAGETYTRGVGKIPLYARLHWDSENQFTVTMSTKGKNGERKPFQETIYTREK